MNNFTDLTTNNELVTTASISLLNFFLIGIQKKLHIMAHYMRNEKE